MLLGFWRRRGTVRPGGSVHRLTVSKGVVLITSFVLVSACVFPAGAASAATGPLTAPAAGPVRQPAAQLVSTPAHGAVFVSPSRNIGCEVDFQFARIGTATFCQTLAPPQSVTITAAGSIQKCFGASCVGHPAKSTPVLSYMTSTASGPFICASRFDGVACSAASKGFLISRSGTTTYNVLPHTTTKIYGDPASNRLLTLAKAFGWVVAVDAVGHDAEVMVECGQGTTGSLPHDDLWTVDLSAIRSFEVETNPAHPAAGSVVGVPEGQWVSAVRLHGWDGYLDLGGAHSFVTDGPGSFVCPR